MSDENEKHPDCYECGADARTCGRHKAEKDKARADEQAARKLEYAESDARNAERAKASDERDEAQRVRTFADMDRMVRVTARRNHRAELERTRARLWADAAAANSAARLGSVGTVDFATKGGVEVADKLLKEFDERFGRKAPKPKGDAS